MLVDSLDMTDADRDVIAQNCLEAPESRIVVTHGTDTMVETATAIATTGSGQDRRSHWCDGAVCVWQLRRLVQPGQCNLVCPGLASRRLCGDERALLPLRPRSERSPGRGCLRRCRASTGLCQVARLRLQVTKVTGSFRIVSSEFQVALEKDKREQKAEAQKPEARSQKTEDRSQKTEARRQKTEDRRQKTEDRRQKTEARSQKPEDRRQKTEDRRQKTEDRRQKIHVRQPLMPGEERHMGRMQYSTRAVVFMFGVVAVSAGARCAA